MADKLSLEVNRGDTLKFPVKIKINDVEQDMTGATVFFTVKRNIKHTDDMALIKKTVAGGGTETWVECTPADTANLIVDSDYGTIYDDTLYGDIQIKLASGETYSALVELTVNADVTRRTS